MDEVDYKQFTIGTLINFPGTDSHGCKGKWRVNCVNMWAATLGQNLTPESAILGHCIILIHEITHALSGESWCLESWDRTIERILKETLRQEIVDKWLGHKKYLEIAWSYIDKLRNSEFC